jgi:hypothetical protein
MARAMSEPPLAAITMQRFKEPVHAYSCAEHTAAAFWSARGCRLPPKWTADPTAQPSTIQAVRRKSGSRKNRYLLRRQEHAQPSVADGVDRAADRDNFRDNQDEIASRVTCTLAYT